MKRLLRHELYQALLIYGLILLHSLLSFADKSNLSYFIWSRKIWQCVMILIGVKQNQWQLFGTCWCFSDQKRSNGFQQAYTNRGKFWFGSFFAIELSASNLSDVSQSGS